jgi:hypothetical protein
MWMSSTVGRRATRSNGLYSRGKCRPHAFARPVAGTLRPETALTKKVVRHPSTPRSGRSCLSFSSNRRLRCCFHFVAGADCRKSGEGFTARLGAVWLAPGFPLPPNTYRALLRRVAQAVARDPLAVRVVVRNPGHSCRARILLSCARRAPRNRCDAHQKAGERHGKRTHVHVPSSCGCIHLPGGSRAASRG